MWGLISDFGRLVRELEPDLVTMENVPELTQHEVFRDFLETMSDYAVSWSVVECAEDLGCLRQETGWC